MAATEAVTRPPAPGQLIWPHRPQGLTIHRHSHLLVRAAPTLAPEGAVSRTLAPTRSRPLLRPHPRELIPTLTGTLPVAECPVLRAARLLGWPPRPSRIRVRRPIRRRTCTTVLDMAITSRRRHSTSPPTVTTVRTCSGALLVRVSSVKVSGHFELLILLEEKVIMILIIFFPFKISVQFRRARTLS